MEVFSLMSKTSSIFFFSFPIPAMFLMRDQSRGEIASHVPNSDTEMHCGRRHHSQHLFSTQSCTVFSVTSNKTVNLFSVQDKTFLMQDPICIKEIKHHNLDMWSRTCCTFLSFHVFIVQCLIYFQVVTMEAELWETVSNLKMIPSNYDTYLNNYVL